jgi:hypothetical protein
MRFDSALASSALSLPRSVTRKRLVVSSACPTTSSVAGSMSCTQRPALTMRPRWTAKIAARSATVMPAAMPALRRGRARIR